MPHVQNKEQPRQGETVGMREAADHTGRGARGKAERVKERVGESYEETAEWAHDTYDHASAWAEDLYDRGHHRLEAARARSARKAARLGRRVKDYAAENPLMIGVVGLAAGLLIGALLPRTRREDQAFGEWSDEVRHEGLRYAQDMTRRGRDYVEEAFEEDDPVLREHESEEGLKDEGPLT
ncbi:hypothetical protein AB4072_15305 [Microvirga sp. 2MCAF38]|uniref:hypothetical protein n=1 Tax=Microvirga sp. 2MCAF38 TaxID=3232989 RepID=UPI003F9C5CD3